MPIHGSINPGSANYFKESLHQAELTRARAVIVQLDTPGGLVQSVREMAQAIEDSNVPVVVWTAPAGASATSAGALLMLASHVAAMAPGTNIGAAHPVGPQGEDVKGAMGEKVVNDVAAFARGLSEIRGRNSKIAQEIVTQSKSYTATEAMREKFIDILAATKEDLLRQLDGRVIKVNDREQTLKLEGSRIVVAEMSWGQSLLNRLADPNIAAVLMTLAMLLIYVELSHPGISVAGILGGICLIIAFMSFSVLPVHTGGQLLLVLGLILILLEPLVASSGLLAAGGIVSFILGLLWVFDPGQADLAVSLMVLVPISIVLVLGVASLVILTARTKKNALAVRNRIGGGALSGLSGYLGIVEDIEPSRKRGKVHIRGEVWDFESESEVSQGDQVRVQEVRGFVVKVSKEPQNAGKAKKE